MRLYGVFNVFQKEPALVIPIFVDDKGNKYSQVIEDDLVSDFREDNTELGLIKLEKTN